MKATMAWRCHACDGFDDEDEDPEEEEFEEEEEPQEEEDDMEVDIEEDENEPELTYPYEEDNDGLLLGLMRRDINSLFGRMASLSRRLCGRETTNALVEKKGKAKDEYYGKLILDLGNEVRSSVEQGTATMEKLVKRLGNAEDKVECKKLKTELEEARGFVFEERSNEAIDVPIMFEERPRTDSIESASDCIKDEKSPTSELRGSPHDA
ncbi:hypothetical protein Tco_0472088 [Tanacetum coccineum]